VKILPLLVGVAVICGAFLLRYSYVAGSAENSVPLYAPFPGHGFTVKDTFVLQSSGRFILRVLVPVADSERSMLHREQPPVHSDVVLKVTGPRGFGIERRITSFENDAWTADSNLYASSERLLLPSAGDYVFSLTNRGDDAVFAERGALVELERFELGGHELRFPLARFLGYSLLIGAVIGTFMAWRK